MSDLSTLISQGEEEIKKLESSVEQSLANHNFLLGLLSGAKKALSSLTSIANAVAPTNPVTAGLDAANAVANEIDNALNGEASDSSENSSASDYALS